MFGSTVTYTAPLQIIDLTVEEKIPQELLVIAECESRNRQFDTTGVVVKSYTNDYGRYQISEIHIPRAEKLGIDIMSEKGNEEFALLLFNEKGTQPWNSSKKCWSKELVVNY